MSVIKFLGDNVYMDNVKGYPISLEKDKEYQAQIQTDGAQFVVNGVPVEDPNATYWVILNNGTTQIPYAKKCLERLWEVVQP